MVLSVLVASLLGGCAGSKRALYERSFESLRHDEVASTHVSVISVAPWDQYMSSLAPQFDWSTKKALAEVMPETRRRQERLLQAVNAAARVALPSVSSSSTLTTTREREGREHTRKSRAVTERSAAPGDVEGLDADADFGRSLDGDGLGALMEAEGALGVDPLMKYRMATALYQEVQLLNQFVLDLAERTDTTPHVVRMQISLMPRARHVPFDAYVNLSFYDEGKGGSSSQPSTVVPLLVTDNVEATAATAGSTQVEQLALAVSGMLYNSGFQAEAARLEEAATASIGRDFNSLLTVGALGENGLRVRLGALQRTLPVDGPGYAALPQTHNVTFVLFTKRQLTVEAYEALAEGGSKAGVARDTPGFRDPEVRTVRYAADVDFVHALTGKSVEKRRFEFKEDKFPELAKTYCEIATLEEGGCRAYESVLGELALAVRTGDFKTFRAHAKLSAAEPHQLEQLWALLLAADVGRGRTGGSFQVQEVLPRFGAALDDYKPDGGSRLLAIADDSKQSRVRIPDVEDAVPMFTQIEARCKTRSKPPTPGATPQRVGYCADAEAGLEFAVPANRIEADRLNGHLIATFPPLSAMEKRVAGKTCTCDWTVGLSYRDPRIDDLRAKFELKARVVANKVEGETNHKVVVANPFIRPVANAGMLQFTVLPKPEAEHVDITIKNATVDYAKTKFVSLDPKKPDACGRVEQPSSGAHFRLKANCRVDAALTNLVGRHLSVESKPKTGSPGTAVTIYVLDEERPKPEKQKQ